LIRGSHGVRCFAKPRTETPSTLKRIINTVTTGISYGMKMYKLYPPGMQIVSIPWHHIDRVLKNMNEMPWTVPGHTNDKEEFYKKAHDRLGVEQII